MIVEKRPTCLLYLRGWRKAHIPKLHRLVLTVGNKVASISLNTKTKFNLCPTAQRQICQHTWKLDSYCSMAFNRRSPFL